ncbi:MAG: BatD family protein [Chloroflexota bacterium]
MKRQGKNAAILFVLTLFFGLVLSAQAQENSITADVSSTTASTDEYLFLTITVAGNNGVSEPRLPPLDAFQVERSGRSSQTSIINGVISSQTTYTFRLRPLEAGTLEIGPITAVIDGQEVTTDPITLTIEQGILPPDADPGLAQIDAETFFMTASVDNPTPYVGEQIIHSVQAYLRLGMTMQAGFDLPDYVGFWVQETSEQTDVAERGDITYRVTQFDTILFPTSVGEKVIEEALVAVSGSSEVDNLNTGTVTVTVRPLPGPAPADFSGAVGELEIEAAVSATTVEVGDSVTMQVILSGFGNIDTLPAPELPDVAGWRKFDTRETNQSQVQFSRFGGRRIYQIFFVPEQGGDVIIPPVSYTFFNPKTEQYETISTEPIAILVTGSAPVAPVGQNEEPIIAAEPEPAAVETASEAETAVIVGDLRSGVDAETAVLPFIQRSWFWLLWLLPLLLLAADYIWVNRHRLRRTLTSEEAALATAQKRLAAAEIENENAFEHSEQALLGYLQDKLGQPVAGLTNSARGKLLQERGVESDVIANIDQMLELTTINRFAPVPTNGTKADLLAKTRNLLETLEKGLEELPTADAQDNQQIDQ